MQSAISLGMNDQLVIYWQWVLSAMLGKELTLIFFTFSLFPGLLRNLRNEGKERSFMAIDISLIIIVLPGTMITIIVVRLEYPPLSEYNILLGFCLVGGQKLVGSPKLTMAVVLVSIVAVCRGPEQRQRTVLSPTHLVLECFEFLLLAEQVGGEDSGYMGSSQNGRQ